MKKNLLKSGLLLSLSILSFSVFAKDYICGRGTISDKNDTIIAEVEVTCDSDTGRIKQIDIIYC
jgi:hypothetical protein